MIDPLRFYIGIGQVGSRQKLQCQVKPEIFDYTTDKNQQGRRTRDFTSSFHNGSEISSPRHLNIEVHYTTHPSRVQSSSSLQKCSAYTHKAGMSATYSGRQIHQQMAYRYTVDTLSLGYRVLYQVRIQYIDTYLYPVYRSMLTS